jgi:hypothetical protein
MSNSPKSKHRSVAEQIIVELIVDDSQLQPTIDRLEKTGQIDAKMAAGFKQTTAEINKQAAAIKAGAASTAPLKKNLDDVNKAVKGMTASFMEGFQEGVIETLKDAGVTAQQFTDALASGATEVSAPTESLRQRLKALTEQISQLKLTGEDNTEQFRELVTEAGRIKDAIGDAGQEIRKAASDTELFDNLLGSAQAVAGGFAVAQGTAALFGDESEDLQKTLLKVNSAMAILQGLQSISNALEKEGAITMLVANAQLKIKNAQQVIDNALTSQSVIVRGAATVAQKALNLAMAANPIGILVVAIAGLITLLATYGRSAATAARQTSNLNVALDAGAKAFEDRADAIKQQGDAVISALENQGAVGSKIAQQEVSNQQLLIEARKQRLAELRKLEAENQEADLEKRQELNNAIRDLDDQLLADSLQVSNLEAKQKKISYEEDLKNRVAATEAALVKAKEGSEQQLALQKQLITQRAALELNADGLLQSQRAAIVAKAEQERQELQAAFDKRRIDLELKSIETRLINVREGSQEELSLKLQQLRLQVQAELTSSKLSEAEKKAIKEKGLQEQLKLQREFNARVRAEAIQAQIDLNTADLVNVRVNAEDKLLLTISNIELAAALEVEAANKNAAKIKAINAKRDADIAVAKKAFIEQQAQNEIDLVTARQGANNRALQRISNDEKASARARIAAVQQIAEFELDNIQTREDALEEERKKRLISDEEYNTRYAQLQDEKAKITEDAEKKITDINTSENEKRRKKDQETIELVVQTTQQVIDIISQINDIKSQKDQERIQGERARIEELREAGAITEKEAILRNKRLDAEEKKLKREAAIRDKNLAIFNAIINTAQAVTKALASAPPPLNAILAGIAGALGAAQIAVIASRPIPKFRTGKKNRYEGPGIIGEAGAELFEHNGRMFVANKETIVWMGKDDKVYTPTETKQMLPEVDHKVMDWKPEDKQTGMAIDYEQLGKSVGRHVKIPGITIDEDGFKVFQQEGMSRKNYMDKYYSSK